MGSTNHTDVLYTHIHSCIFSYSFIYSNIEYINVGVHAFYIRFVTMWFNARAHTHTHTHIYIYIYIYIYYMCVTMFNAYEYLLS